MIVGAAVCLTVVAVGAVAVVASAAMMASSTAHAADAAAEAQKYAAEANAKATVEASKNAMNAQIESSKQEAKAQMYESDTDLKRDQAFIDEEKWYAGQKSSETANYQQEIAAVDSIDITYSDQGPSGTGTEGSYDYGNDGGSGGGVSVTV